jgi:hypothetical protein
VLAPNNKTPAPTPKLEKRADGTLYAVAGFSRSGKSTWVDQKTRGARRLLVWDYPKGEWAIRFKCRPVSSFEELAAIVRCGSKPERIAFMRVSEQPEEDFQTWSRLAWIYVQAHGAPLAAEELSSVTHPGKAPAAWGNICRMGLGYGSDIYAVTQRPAESDKTSLGNAGVIHCGIMGTLDDRKTMAKYLDVSLAEVQALKQFEWIERDRRNFALTRGKVKKSRT